MAVSTSYKRLFLRGLKWDSEDQGKPILDVLKTVARARLVDTASGSVLRSTSGNGATVEFALPAGGQGITPQDAAELCEEIFTFYEVAAAGIGKNPSNPADEAAIYAEMLALLTKVDEVSSDFTCLRD